MIRRQMQSPRRLASQQSLIDTKHQRAQIKPLAHPWLEITGVIQLLMQPALPVGFGISRQFVAGAIGTQRGRDRLRSQHSRLDRGMYAFDARRIEKTGIVADQRTTGENQPWQRLVASSGDCPCAISDPSASFEEAAHKGMAFIALEFLERR